MLFTIDGDLLIWIDTSVFGMEFLNTSKTCDMELRNENTDRKRKRKLVSKGPMLVRSVKAGQAMSLSFNQERKANLSFWKNA